MKQVLTLSLLALLLCSSCNNNTESSNEEQITSEKQVPKKKKSSSSGNGLWKGTFSNGMKGATISFEVDGNELKELTFEGYWRCDGRLELTTIGPKESFTIEDGEVNGVIIEPEDGPAPFRFELQGTIGGSDAEGTLRIINAPAGCDTYKLNWTATKE